jgi:alpha-tubulin suppressor-like RCC1 family protein
MDNLIHKCIGNYLALNYWFQSTCGEHYPRELAQFIIKLYYHLFKIKIKCGRNHSVLLFDNQVYVWGGNDHGQLGIEKITNINSPQKLDLPNIKKIECGTYYTMALTHSNEVYAWGSNTSGQLGLATTPKGDAGRFADPGEKFLSIDLPHKLDLPSIKKIICGSYHTIALTHSGEIYVWGSNSHGQLGLGHETNVYTPQKLDFPNIKKIICRAAHTMIITHSNEVYVWGSNTGYELGLGHSINMNSPQKLDLLNVKKIICGHEHTFAITYSDEIYVWGYNNVGELGSEPPTNKDGRFIKSPQKIDLPNVKKISCGEYNTMFITHSNEVYGVGHNNYGELGLGHCGNTSLPEKLDLSNIKKIICGSFHTLALTYSNEVYTWGHNRWGRLGLGHNDDKNTPQKLKF